MSVHQRLHKQLPFTILVLGRRVTFSQIEGGRVGINSDEEGKKRAIRLAMVEWDRRGQYIGGPADHEHLARMEGRLLVKDYTAQFLKFFFSQPIGMPLCIFNTSIPFQEYNTRLIAINEAFLTWDAINHWPKKSDGKLAKLLPCAGFTSRIPQHECENDDNWKVMLGRYRCSTAVSDPSGLCPGHRKPDARTLFNFYPFFNTEGFPELAT